MTAATDTADRTAEFVEFFADLWRIGATDPERFFADCAARMTPDARLIQPLAPTTRGPDGMRRLFSPVFEAIPDLRSEVNRWGPTEDGVLIEHTLSGTLGGKPLSWTAVDRFILRGELFEERRAYFDPLPLVGAMLRRPRTSLKLLPGLFRRKERT